MKKKRERKTRIKWEKAMVTVDEKVESNKDTNQASKKARYQISKKQRNITKTWRFVAWLLSSFL